MHRTIGHRLGQPLNRTGDGLEAKLLDGHYAIVPVNQHDRGIEGITLGVFGAVEFEELESVTYAHIPSKGKPQGC